MILPDEVKCKTCGRIFCCAKCRLNHQEKMHTVDDNANLNKENQYPTKNFECIICGNQPLILYPKISDDLLIHIARKHLPLRCKKCCKMYTSIEDLILFSKCSNEKQHECSLLENKAIINQTDNCISIGIQTSPYLSAISETQKDDELTPMSMLNLKWKAKVNNGTSVSSIRNISSITNSSDQRIINGSKQTKTVRTTTTSTPMPITLMKVHQKGFDASSCQVSSIHSASTESDNSPIMDNLQTPPSPPTNPHRATQNSSNIQKSKSRVKIRVNATPLRQVMSKSIQRAIIEHAVVRGALPKKKISDLMDSAASAESPLDLRTSPALRRTRSEVIASSSAAFQEFKSSREEIHFTSKKLMAEYLISSTSTKESGFEKSNTVYKTCHQSIEVVTATTGIRNLLEKSEEKLLKPNEDVEPSYLSVTPKISGLSAVPLKKTISFETPNTNFDNNSDISDEVFYTPFKSPSQILSTHTNNSETFDDKSHDLGISKINDNSTKQEAVQHKVIENNSNNNRGGGLWSLLTSVMRFKSFGGKDTNFKNENNNKNEHQNPSLSLIKRCASFAGVLSKAKTSVNDDITQAQKRKRTSTLDAQVRSSIPEHNFTYDTGTPAKRIRRIQGRKPIERMRNQC